VLVSAGDTSRYVAEAMALAVNAPLRHMMQSQTRPRAMEMGWTAIMEKLESVYLSMMDTLESAQTGQPQQHLINAA
jgi:hypothetical protein